jgi:hypothetical protein
VNQHANEKWGGGKAVAIDTAGKVARHVNKDTEWGQDCREVRGKMCWIRAPSRANPSPCHRDRTDRLGTY